MAATSVAVGLALAAPAVVIAKAAPSKVLDDFQIQIIGTDHKIGNAVLAASLTEQTRNQEDVATQDLLGAARADYARIVNALYGLGYYSGVVHVYVDGREASTIAALDAPAHIGKILITVDPGPQFTFSRAEARPVTPKTELPDGFKRGEPALSGDIVDAASAGINGWRDEGHAKARVASQSVTADHRSNTLDAQIGFDPGPTVTFGDMSVSGEKRVRLERIRKIAGFPTGEKFDPDEVDAVAKRLRRTGAFSSVSLTEADTLGPNNSLDYKLALVEQKRRQLSFGAEVSSDEGTALQAGWMHRNLFGGAEKLSIDGEISGIGGSNGTDPDYTLTTRLERPGTPFRDSAAFVEAEISHEDEDDYSADKGKLTFGLTRYITDQLTGEIALGVEASDVTDDNGTTNYREAILPFTLTWDSRDNALDATKGYYAKGAIKPFAGLNDTTGTGAQLDFDTRGYLGFGKDDRIVLAGRLQGGWIVGSDLAETPRDYLYYAGGGGTVRGQPYQSLGISELPDGQDSGGTKFAAASLELRADVTKAIGVVAFYDVGFVGGDSTDGTQSGAGLGLRYNTGIGPIRLDVAAPVDGDTGDGMQFYIGIGQAF